MRRWYFSSISAAAAIAASGLSLAHEADYDHRHVDETDVRPLPQVAEETGPVHASPVGADGRPLSGQGFWTFAAASDVLPIPEEAAAHVPGAHGTLVVDHQKDVVYWGLGKVGWIAFEERLAEGRIVEGDPVFANGNLHGADLYAREGAHSLIAVTDNVSGEVYLTDTTFAEARILGWPEDGPYRGKRKFRPTDVAFLDETEFYVTDGYGQAFFMQATADPLQYKGPFMGGKELSKTPHGITYQEKDDTLFIAARPEGQIKRVKVQDPEWLETYSLPPGSTVCDVDIWGDYALAPCLKGPDGSPGPIYILNLKTRAIASVIKPKEELGFDQAEHIHDAAWYFSGAGQDREVYILFTNWNPGGIGALKLVNLSTPPDAER